MTRILVLYCSSWGKIDEMPTAVADGAAVGGARVDVRRVAETAPPDIVKSLHYNVDYKYPSIESTEQLADYDGIIVGTPTPIRFAAARRTGPRRSPTATEAADRAKMSWTAPSTCAEKFR